MVEYKHIEIDGKSFEYREPGALDIQHMMAGGMNPETGTIDPARMQESIFTYSMQKLVKTPVITDEMLYDPTWAMALTKLSMFVSESLARLDLQKKN